MREEGHYWVKLHADEDPCVGYWWAYVGWWELSAYAGTYKDEQVIVVSERLVPPNSLQPHQ